MSRLLLVHLLVLILHLPIRPIGIKEAYAQVVAEEEREEKLKLQRAEPSPKVDPVPLASSSPAKPLPQVIPVRRSSPSPLRPFSKAGAVRHRNFRPFGIKEAYAWVVAQEKAEEAAAAKAKTPVSPQQVSPQKVQPRLVTPQRVKRRSVRPAHVSPSLFSPSLVRPGPMSPSHFSPTLVRLAPNHFCPTPVRPASTSPALVSPTPVRPAPIPPAPVTLAPVSSVPDSSPPISPPNFATTSVPFAPYHFLPPAVCPAPISPAPVSPTPVRPASISPAPVSPPHVAPPRVCPAPISTPPLDWRPPKRPVKVFPATAAEVIRRFREAKAARLRAGNQEPNLTSILEDVIPSPQKSAASSHRHQDPVQLPVQPPVRPPVQPLVRPPVQPPVRPPVQRPVPPPVQPPRTPTMQTFESDLVRTMHTRWSSPDTVELYPGNAPSPRVSQLELWRQLSKLPLDDQIAGRALTPPPAPKEPTPASSPLQPSDVELSDDLMDGEIPMYQLAAMMAKARDGTPEPPSRPDTPSNLHGGMTGYSLTPPRYWWKNEPTPPRKHLRLHLEDDPSFFTYDFSRTVTPPNATFHEHCSLGFVQARDKELKRQVKVLREALDMKTPPAEPSPPPPRSPSPLPQKVTFVDEDGNTLDCQDGPAPPRRGPSSCRKVPCTLPQAPGLPIPAVPSLRLVHSIASAPPYQPSSSTRSKFGLAAAAGIASIALGFSARWMMS